MTADRVLMVEDQADLLSIMSDALSSLGYEVHAASNGVKALAMLEGDLRFSHVISDFSMPEGISGLDLAEHAARLQPQAQVILVSGYARAQLQELPEGIRFLPKPYRLGQLLETLRGN